MDDKNYRWRVQESHWVYKESLSGLNSVRFQNLDKFADVADLTKLFWKRFCSSFFLSMFSTISTEKAFLAKKVLEYDPDLSLTQIWTSDNKH